MTIKTWENEIFETVSFCDGIDGKGETVFIVSSTRRTETGRGGYHTETFKSYFEAVRWLKYSLNLSTYGLNKGP